MPVEYCRIQIRKDSSFRRWGSGSVREPLQSGELMFSRRKIVRRFVNDSKANGDEPTCSRGDDALHSCNVCHLWEQEIICTVKVRQ